MIQSLLFIYHTLELLNKQIEDLKKEHRVDSFNFFPIVSEESLGIETIRKVKSEIMTTKSSGVRMIVFYKFESASPEAQNALLKILEEPPSNTIIVLVASNEKNILQTIRSRSFIKYIGIADETDIPKTMEEFKILLSQGPGQRIEATLPFSKSKDQAISWLNKLQQSLVNFLLNDSPPYDAKTMAPLVKKIDLAKGFLEVNVSPRAVLDVLFLGFPTIPIS